MHAGHHDVAAANFARALDKQPDRPEFRLAHAKAPLIPITNRINQSDSRLCAPMKYLPQKFVEWLCAPENNQELEAEIEKVIYQRNKKTERLQASNFQELRKATTQPIETKREPHSMLPNMRRVASNCSTAERAPSKIRKHWR